MVADFLWYYLGNNFNLASTVPGHAGADSSTEYILPNLKFTDHKLKSFFMNSWRNR